MEKTIRRRWNWDNRETENLYLRLDQNAERYKHVKSLTRAAHRLWNNKGKTGLETGTARKRAVAWLAARLREEFEATTIGTQASPADTGDALQGIAWLDVAEHLFYDFDPTEDCWPRWSIEIDEAEETAALEPIKRQRREGRDGPLFEHGDLVISLPALDALQGADIRRAVNCHILGDWGDVSREDWEENEISLRDGYRLVSVYHSLDGTEFWLFTEADRSRTTVFLRKELRCRK